MKVGDLAFFYASNTKVPGIVGIMEIVQEVSPDQSAFDKESAYYDPKGDPTKPKWQLVHVEFRRKFGEKISLKELQSFAKDGGRLENMQLIKRTRLSVTPVTPAEWKFIMSLATDEEDEVPDVTAATEVDKDMDFATAFEAPASLDNVAGDVNGADDASDEANAIAAGTLGNGVGPPVITETITEQIVTEELIEPTPTIEQPISSTEAEVPAGDTAVGDQSIDSAGILDTLKSVVGLGAKAPSRATSRAGSRAPSRQPASRAGSRAPSVKASSRAGSRAPSLSRSVRAGSRAGSMVPASQPEGSNDPEFAPTPTTGGKGHSKTSRISAQTAPIGESILEEDEEFVVVDPNDVQMEDEDTIDAALARPLSYA